MILKPLAKFTESAFDKVGRFNYLTQLLNFVFEIDQIWGQSILLSVALTPKGGHAEFSDSVSCSDFSVREVCDGSFGSQ